MRKVIARASLSALAIVVITVFIGLTTGLLTIDHYASTYGISIGTNNDYASAEITHGTLTFSAEHAR